MASNQKQNQSGQVLRVTSKIKPAVTKYYLKVSKRYRVLQLLLLLCLVLYIFIIVSAFGKFITYDNMQYLLRDFDSITRTGDSEFSSIRYDRQNEQTFTVFKNGIAAAGKESFSLYDSSGLRLCSDKLSYTDPVLVPSEKYLLLYDMGGKGYSVYNSMTRIISRTEENKIVDGDMSDSGDFILVTRSGETKYVVKHFNSALSNTMNIYKDNYVLDAAISPDGGKIVIVSAVPSATDFDCEIALHKAGDSENAKKITLSRTMPLSVHFGEDGFTLLCDSGLYFYNEDGEAVSTHTLSGMTLEYADLSAEYTVLAASENALGSENRILVFDSNGTLLANDMLRERVTGVAASGEKDDALAYVLTPDRVIRLTAAAQSDPTDDTAPRYSGFEAAEEATNGEDVLAVCTAQKGVIICTATEAYYLFNEWE
ncbi:MAG: hypothetical protein E7638_01395 [Ruminococcaceae bacterium]|nr:hypothetical protein [Oscillospiraceae bacterium]